MLYQLGYIPTPILDFGSEFWTRTGVSSGYSVYAWRFFIRDETDPEDPDPLPGTVVGQTDSDVTIGL